MNTFILLMSLYLLGSVKGASGQPDAPFASMDHQGSIQQLSDEYLSPVNPSDVEALYETSSGKNVLTEHSSSEHSSREHAADEHSADEHTVGKHAANEHTSNEHATGEETSDEHDSGAETSGEHASGEETSGEKPSGEKAAGEQALDEHASNEQPSSTPLPNISSGKILNCHTCAYMNDQGKCLRGEGTCTTENSQQCMLKKIFEGGKLQFMVQGCENKCPSMNLISHGTRMQIICCRNTPFCNKV
ncbi:acrosomal protein SP-10 isoform X3 [Octodon degus]|uniref:Acrosomal protein SP-10 isoform X3 n=1 Tax=Octodon degus TaxID=10160 RepID=A0A6P6DB20_OCTDE|nr:acrosomal protein SP-10 isoform X3 [Octodon degus]